MIRLLLILVVLFGSVPAWAADNPPSTQDKLHYLGDYSLALGRKFGCDGKGDEMVSDIKRYTYVLQFDDADGTAAQEVAKQNLTDGIKQSKADQASCPTVAQHATEVESAARDNRALMQSAGHNIALVSGAAQACNVPSDEVEQMLKAGMLYTHNDGDDAKPPVSQWLAEGHSEVATNKIGCDTVKAIFGQVKTIFTP